MKQKGQTKQNTKKELKENNKMDEFCIFSRHRMNRRLGTGVSGRHQRKQGLEPL